MKTFLVTSLLLIIICLKSFGQVRLKIALDADGSTYKVILVAAKSYTGINALISSSQITLVVPHESGSNAFSLTSVSSSIPNMRWTFSGRANSPIENPDKDYLFFNFINNSSPIVRFDIAANQEIVLFTFKRISPCTGKIAIFDNLTDAFLAPNSYGVNPGNSFSLLGAGGDAYAGNLDAPPTVALKNNIVAPCANTQLTVSAIPSLSGSYLYQWYVNDNPIGNPTQSSIFSFNLPPNEADVITKVSVKLVQTGSNTCESYSTRSNQNILVKGTPNAKIQFSGGTCVVLPAKIQTNYNSQYQYQWQLNGQDIVGATYFSYDVQKSGSYTIKITKNGCEAISDPQKIIGVTDDQKISVNAGNDTTIVAGDAAQLNGKSNRATIYSWAPADLLNKPDIINPIAHPLESTKFTLTASNDNGCPVSASVMVSVLPRLYIPNAFSPNNDGQNDDWQITNIGAYPDCTVEIYNRWGTKIYYSEGNSQPWDGKINGENAEATSYFYVIKTKYKIYQGQLELIR